jgi:hypothetical protein
MGDRDLAAKMAERDEKSAEKLRKAKLLQVDSVLVTSLAEIRECEPRSPLLLLCFHPSILTLHPSLAIGRLRALSFAFTAAMSPIHSSSRYHWSALL